MHDILNAIKSTDSARVKDKNKDLNILNNKCLVGFKAKVSK